MKRIRVILSGFVIVLAALSFSSDARADELQISDVSAFLNVQESLKPIDKEFRATGAHSIFRPKALGLAKTSLPAYQENIETLKSDHPKYYTRMNDIVTGYVHEETSHPYSTIEEWAEMGDRVMTAFYAAGSGDGGAGAVKEKLETQMPPEVMAFLPAESLAALEDLIGSLETIDSVSDHDKQVVSQFTKQIAFHLQEYSSGYVVTE